MIINENGHGNKPAEQPAQSKKGAKDAEQKQKAAQPDAANAVLKWLAAAALRFVVKLKERLFNHG